MPRHEFSSSTVKRCESCEAVYDSNVCDESSSVRAAARAGGWIAKGSSGDRETRSFRFPALNFAAAEGSAAEGGGGDRPNASSSRADCDAADMFM